MPSGRSSDRDRRRRGEDQAARRPGRARRGESTAKSQSAKPPAGSGKAGTGKSGSGRTGTGKAGAGKSGTGKAATGKPSAGKASAAASSARTGPKRPSGQGKRPGGQSSARPRAHTGGAFKLSSTRRAALLALLVCAMALSISVPLRTYLNQQVELSSWQQKQTDLTKQVADLQQRREELSDPAHVETEARARLGYVRPGETPYIVQVPAPAAPPPKGQPGTDTPWYENLWKSLSGEGS